MIKKLWILLFVLVLVGLSACSEKSKYNVEDSGVPEILEVQLEVPETVDINGKVEMKAIVTQGNEDVTDADTVEFEIWEEGKKEESRMIESKNNNDGTYEAETTFDRDGVFTIQVHVTARGMHNMPKKSVIVGEGAAHEKDHADHGSIENEDGFAMHFMKPESVEAGKEIVLTVHLNNENVPLEKARVRYEIWNGTSEKHDWIEVKESSPGEYTAMYAFNETGTYTVQIHVENDDGLHEHDEYQVKVESL